VEWAEYRLGDLFEKINTNNVIKNGLGDLSATTAVLSNNQIGKYISRKNATILKNVFSATSNGFGKAFYQPKDFTVLQDSYAFKFKDNSIKIQKIHSFIVGALNKVFSKYNWGNKSGWNKVKEEKIHLPTKNGEIDFEFMESFIAELEAELKVERVAYLQVTGLADYILTTEEEKVLEEFENGEFEWGEITYKSMFNNIVQGRRLKKDDQLTGNIPFVMAGVTNTGIVNYISNPISRFPKNSITVDIFGNTFYRNYDFGAGDDTGVYWNDVKLYTLESMLFFSTSMAKSLIGKFDYGKKLRSSQSYELKMYLPIYQNQPDYRFMETFISAIQKLVIKDVVEYADQKIKATKSVIEN
jgi:hypothetical protein